jgi:hypothetical protein
LINVEIQKGFYLHAIIDDVQSDRQKIKLSTTVSSAAFYSLLKTFRIGQNMIVRCPCEHRAKRIVNHAVVNEDPNAKIIRELRAEVSTTVLDNIFIRSFMNQAVICSF